jgi:para-nitrobenzyl esterase
LAALRWVKENIAALGGDPDNVTIAGQPAGVMACIYLLTISQAKGLVRRVIAISGSVGVGLTPARAEFAANEFRTILGVTDDDGVLAQVPVTAFIAAQEKSTAVTRPSVQPVALVRGQRMGYGFCP